MRVGHEDKRDGVRITIRKRAMGLEFTMRERAMGWEITIRKNNGVRGHQKKER